MNENLFQNNPEFSSLSKFFAKLTKSNQSLEYLDNDDVAKLRSLVDRAISKLKKIYDISDNLVLDTGDETQNNFQISTVSIFSLISQSLYILSQQKQTRASDDELIVSLHSRNEQLEEENRLLKSKMGIQDDDFDDEDYNISSDGVMGNAAENSNLGDGYKGNNSNNIILKICNKLKLSKKTNNEGELINILSKEINKSKKIKQEIIRHYKLNFDNHKNITLANIIQSLDKHIKHEVENHDDLRSELTEATEGLIQLQKELEYITKSVAKKDDKISQLRSERNEARKQLSELLETIKKSNYTSRSIINPEEDRNENETAVRNEQKETELEEVKNELYQTQTSLKKKKQKIEKLKKKIESLEENKLIESMNHQANLISNLTNSIDNIEANLNKSQSKLKSRSILNDANDNNNSIPNEDDGIGINNDENLFELKKQLINMKDTLNQKEEQITNLKNFVSEIASQYENASNELCEESKNKYELARCVQLLLDANHILESLLETSNQQKVELKHQLDNSIFKAQNNSGTTTILNDNMSEYSKNADQFLLQKMKKMTSEVFNDEEDESTAKLNMIFINENHSTDSELILEIYKFILDFISTLKIQLNNANNNLNEEKSFTSHLYSACLGQLRFILDLSDSRLMQNWILGDENEEWIRQTLQVQVARMESFFDSYAESYAEHVNQKGSASSMNPIQQIEKGIFEEFLPLSKSLNINSNSSKNSKTANNNNVDDALLIPLSTRVSEYLSSYKDKMAFDKMTGENKDLYIMLIQAIAANNVLQIFATEAGSQCKNQFNEIRNLQSQLSLLNRANYQAESSKAQSQSKSKNDNKSDNNNNNSNENQNEKIDAEADTNAGDDENNNKKKKKKKEKDANERNVYEEISNIKKILRRGVSRMISSNKNDQNNDNEMQSNDNKGEKQIPFSDLFICLKCIEKAEKVSLDKDKYVRKLEKHLVKLDIIIKDTNSQVTSIKNEMSSLQEECQSRIADHEQTVAKLNKQLSKRDKELKFLKEAILMLNYGSTAAFDEASKQINSESNGNKNENNEDASTKTNDNDEEERRKASIMREQYEEVVNGLRDEVDALEKKVTKMTEDSKNKIEQIKDKSKKKRSKLLSTINFLTNQKKEIEEEQAKERDSFQRTIEKVQSENSQLKQKVDDLNESLSTFQSKLSKSQIENKLLKSRLKNEEEKSEREKSLLESRMKLKAFSIENAMKDKIEEARKQQQSKHRELIIFIYNLFSDEVELLMKNEEAESNAALMSQETDDSVYSFLQNVKTKMSKLERSSFACDSVMNELNEIRRIIENFINSSPNQTEFEYLETNSKCSRIIKEILDSFSEKAAKFQSQENELKRLKMDSSTASKVIEKAKEAIEWENWCRRIQRFITEGFESKQATSSNSSSAPISPSQVLRQNVGNLNLNLAARITSPKEMRNKLEEAVYASVSGNIKKILRKLEILKTEKSIFTQFYFNNQAQQCIFFSQNNRNNYKNNDDYNDAYNRFSNISFYHLIIVSLIVVKIEKLSGHVQSFFSMKKKNPDSSDNNDNVDNENQNYQITKVRSPNGKTTKPIFSQFISPM